MIINSNNSNHKILMTIIMTKIKMKICSNNIKQKFCQDLIFPNFFQNFLKTKMKFLKKPKKKFPNSAKIIFKIKILKQRHI